MTDIDYIAIYRDSDNHDEFIAKAKAQGADEDEAINMYYEINSKYEEPWMKS